MKFNKAIPILYCKDVSVSVQYFVEQLKFEKKWVYDTPGSFGGVSNGDLEIFFCKEFQGHPGTWIYITIDDVDAYYELIKDSGANILSTPENQEWNMREMLVECPDGHVIRFAQNTESD